jgi:hypothetical protein
MRAIEVLQLCEVDAPLDTSQRGARPDPACSNRLIVLADFRMRAQHGVDSFEHVAHAGFGDRALDHHDEFRLVG